MLWSKVDMIIQIAESQFLILVPFIKSLKKYRQQLPYEHSLNKLNCKRVMFNPRLVSNQKIRKMPCYQLPQLLYSLSKIAQDYFSFLFLYGNGIRLCSNSPILEKSEQNSIKAASCVSCHFLSWSLSSLKFH